ncbi:hypothetical protein MPEAHAMD_3594 [Methylobacterium frigidaeris]|jgi:hypothetical protein|uniref:Uncharacterized protein n=1 Tax=Methylobacterium frigidaeris TaxID=2038277 RepID=A0AA37HDD6_9HYPH|nr:chromate transporter [Methylobacterium frigidaeris]GJD63426.1 hypothetical protein MPEAHAMD_3594 [Methylobacterium frigidaeris]
MLLTWGAILLLPVAAILIAVGPNDVFSHVAVFFSKMAMVTFGGAYAVLSYVAQQAVEHYGWLKPGEMLDLVATRVRGPCTGGARPRGVAPRPPSATGARAPGPADGERFGSTRAGRRDS